MRPPCASMIDRQIESPMPIPSGFVEKNALEDALKVRLINSGSSVFNGYEYAMAVGLLGADG